MTEDHRPDESIKLSKDQREFYESLDKELFNLPWTKLVEKVLRQTFLDIHNLYDEELGNGLTHIEINNKLKPLYRGTPSEVAAKVQDVLITGLIEDSLKRIDNK